MAQLTFDLLTEDKKNNEFVAYLVETGPWTQPINERLQQLQNKLYDAFDVIVDGHLASKFTESSGKRIRIQVDSHDFPPDEILNFVRNFSQSIQSNAEYQKAIAKSPFVESIRIVNGCDLGRKFN